MDKRIFFLIGTVFYLLTTGVCEVGAAPFTEPTIGDYSKDPVLTSISAQPNIHVILDNSGSMNCMAYDKNVAYSPLELNQQALSVYVAAATDDSEEPLDTGAAYTIGNDLEFGRWDYNANPALGKSLVGLRFQNIAIPKGTTIVSAEIEFEAKLCDAGYAGVAADCDPALNAPISLKIRGEAADDAATFAPATNDISDRDESVQSVIWNHDHATEPWNPGTFHTTPELKTIVQGLVNRTGWVSGNDIAFTIEYATEDTTASRTVYAFGGGGNAPRLSVVYRAESGTKYYGYFDPEWFYIYEPNKFNRTRSATVHGYKKVTFVDTAAQAATINALPAPQTPATACAAGNWYVRWPANFTSPASNELTWNHTCIDNNDMIDMNGGTNTDEGLWDGNFMNYAFMRRIDVARKVLTGGKGAQNAAKGEATLSGQDPDNEYCDDQKIKYDTSSTTYVTPYSGTHQYFIDEGYFNYDLDDDSKFDAGEAKYTLDILVSKAYEPKEFTASGAVGGLLQTFQEAAYWGIQHFDTAGNEGGYVAIPPKLHAQNSTFISDVNSLNPETSTPLGETLYTAMQFFRMEDQASGYNQNFSTGSHIMDPFMRDNQPVSCVKSFVIYITDGQATSDGNVPTYTVDETGATVNLEDYDGDSGGNEPSGESMDDIALFMHTNDLRNSFIGKSDIPDRQTIDIYTVFAFGKNDAASDTARVLLKRAAMNGGFEDLNSDNRPNWNDANNNGVWDVGETAPEFDKDNDHVPDHYFEAQDGQALKDQLTAAISDILAKSASGTAVSVLATSSRGEGQMVQAYFKPKTTGDSDGETEMYWAGYLQSLWVDSYGNMREDTVTDQVLDIENDMVIKFDVVAGDTKVQRYAVSAATPYPNWDPAKGVVATPIAEGGLDSIKPLWEAGKVLHSMFATDRKIFTYTDGTTTDQFGGMGVDFTTGNVAHLTPYFGINSSSWDYLGGATAERAENLINYTLGYDSNFIGISGMRNRTIKVDGAVDVWKLGDIIHSTPITIQEPPDNYGLIYSDASYGAYKKKHQVHTDTNGDLAGWETMVYVGANDGMLHAFTGWKYDEDAKAFKRPGSIGVTGTNNPLEAIGQEVWAYIPRALLPHLKWHPNTFYDHTYYVDLTPKVIDAKIFAKDAIWHIGSAADTLGWGTILIGGLGLGGKEIDVDFNLDGTNAGDMTFKPTYFAIDITDPRNPQVMWERSYADLGFSNAAAAVIKVKDQWLLVFGSGPEDYDGNSSHPGRVYVVDLLTGDPVRGKPAGVNTDYLFDLGDGNAGPYTYPTTTVTNRITTIHDGASMAGAASVDKMLNYNVDGTYIGESYNAGTVANPDWKGAMYKITVPWRCKDWWDPASTCTIASYGDVDLVNGTTGVGEYVDDPNDADHPWFISRLFDSPGPVTAPPALSVDNRQNTWIYFGTGRYITNEDKGDISQQYLYGLKDPFFNYRAVVNNLPACCSIVPNNPTFSNGSCQPYLTTLDITNFTLNTNPNFDPACITLNSYTSDYFMNYEHSMLIDEEPVPAAVSSRLFDGDAYKVFYPWTRNPSVQGTCTQASGAADNPNYMIGDLYGDDTCLAYRWECKDTSYGACNKAYDNTFHSVITPVGSTVPPTVDGEVISFMINNTDVNYTVNLVIDSTHSNFLANLAWAVSNAGIPGMTVAVGNGTNGPTDSLVFTGGVIDPDPVSTTGAGLAKFFGEPAEWNSTAVTPFAGVGVHDGEEISFTINGVDISYTVQNAAGGNCNNKDCDTAPPELANHVIAAINAAGIPFITATLGNGTNGGVVNSIVLSGGGYVLSNMASTPATGIEAQLGLTAGTYGKAILGQTGDVFGDISCVCDNKTDPPANWGVFGTSVLCEGITEGQLGDVSSLVGQPAGTCLGAYWEGVPSVAQACDDVAWGSVVGTVVTDYPSLGDTCTGSVNVDLAAPYAVNSPPDNIYYWPRPAGDCTNVAIGDTGIIDNPNGDEGYCRATFWTCQADNGSGACDPANYPTAVPAINYLQTTGVDVDALTAANTGVAPVPDCICSFVEEPYAHLESAGAASALDFFDMLDIARLRDGWRRELPDQRERNVTKPGILGGISLFTTFVPSDDECQFGGSSYLYALYYETGTAYLTTTVGFEVIGGVYQLKDRVLLGTGLASQIGLHIGLQEGNKASGFVQQSTGAITALDIDPAFRIRSGLTSWRED